MTRSWRSTGSELADEGQHDMWCCLEIVARLVPWDGMVHVKGGPNVLVAGRTRFYTAGSIVPTVPPLELPC